MVDDNYKEALSIKRVKKEIVRTSIKWIVLGVIFLLRAAMFLVVYSADRVVYLRDVELIGEEAAEMPISAYFYLVYGGLNILVALALFGLFVFCAVCAKKGRFRVERDIVMRKKKHSMAALIYVLAIGVSVLSIFIAIVFLPCTVRFKSGKVYSIFNRLLYYRWSENFFIRGNQLFDVIAPGNEFFVVSVGGIAVLAYNTAKFDYEGEKVESV